MRTIFLLAGAAALAFPGAAFAKPGNGHGNPHAFGGLRNPHAYGANGPVGYGAGGCPPGLAKKNPPCVPPGQARRLYGIGDRVAVGTSLLGLNALPRSLRTRHRLTTSGRYLTSNGYVYQVDPRTRRVTGVVRTR